MQQPHATQHAADSEMRCTVAADQAVKGGIVGSSVCFIYVFACCWKHCVFLCVCMLLAALCVLCVCMLLEALCVFMCLHVVGSTVSFMYTC